MFGRNRFAALMRKEVEVHTSSMTYRGTLVEVTMEDVKLRGETGWIIVPMERVRHIYEEGKSPRLERDPTRESTAALFMDEATRAEIAQDNASLASQDASPSPFDLEEVTEGIDFDPVPMAPFDEATPAEFRELPGKSLDPRSGGDSGDGEPG
jgi:hypothetical protein